MKKKQSKLDHLREAKAHLRKAMLEDPDDADWYKAKISKLSEKIRAGMDPKSREADKQVEELWDAWEEAKDRRDREKMDSLRDEIGEMYEYIAEEGLESVS